MAWQDGPRVVKLKARERTDVTAISITGSGTGRIMARALAPGKPVQFSKNAASPNDNGESSDLSVYGPMWGLDIKPNTGAPSKTVPLTTSNGAYSSDSGTCFPAPLVAAGVFALVVAEARGASGPALLNSSIMLAAEPQGSLETLLP